MNNKNLKIILIVISILSIGVLFYPKQMTLAPKVELTILYENGDIAKNIEVKRTYINHVVSDGWNQDYLTTDANGKVRFEAVEKRVPIIIERLKYYSTFLSMHESTSTVGTFISRDPKNYFIQGRVDYNDEDCCPEQLILKNEATEFDDSYFNMGREEN